MAAITTRAGKGTPLTNDEIDDNVLFHDTKGGDIASAGTVDLDAATGRWAHITGTTGITAFTLGAGKERLVFFDDALTITHNGTSCICPGGVDVTTVAGDAAFIRAETADNVRIIHFPLGSILASRTGAETLTNKTLTAPTINGGTATALTALGIRSTAAAFDLTMASDEALTEGRTLTWTMGDAARSITLGGDLSYANAFTTSGNFAMTLTATAASNATLPAGTDTLAGLGTAQSFTKAQRGAYAELTDAATIALDLSLGNNYSVALGGNRTLGAPTNAAPGQTGQISVRQDATGSRTLAYAWPYVWAGGTAGVLTTAGCSLDQLIYDVETYASSDVTITIATPGVVSWTGHGLKNGQRIQLTTTGALPTGLSASTTYFVTNASADAFSLSTTLANAAAGTKIATSGSQSGTHTMIASTIKMALNKAYA